MTDNDDYMTAKATDDLITENMWDRLQEGINANRRFRLKGVAGGDNMVYDTTKVVWSTDIYIYFTRESDGVWVYNKINANPTTGITCDNDDILHVVLNDTTTTVLTVLATKPTDDTGRVLVLGAVSNSTWYGNILGGVDVTQVEAVITAELVNGQSIDNAIDSLIGTHAALTASHGVAQIANHGEIGSQISTHAALTATHGVAQIANHAEIASQIATHKALASDHHTKYAITDTFSSQEVTQLQTIGESTTISAAQWGYVGSMAGVPMDELYDDTEPTLGADLNLYGSSILCSDISSNEASGLIVTLNNTGGVLIGDAVYVTTSGTVAKADADSSATMPAIGLATQTKATGLATKILIYGYMYYPTGWNWVDGGEGGNIYVSPSPGLMSQTPPSGTGDQVQVIGTAVTPDRMLVMPSLVLVEIN